MKPLLEAGEPMTVTGPVKPMPTSAFSSVPITISGSRSESIFQPGACGQDRASGRAIVSIYDMLTVGLAHRTAPGEPVLSPPDEYVTLQLSLYGKFCA